MLGETIRTSRMFRTVKDMKRKRTRFRRTSRAVSLTAAVLVIGLAAVGLAAILSGGSWWPHLRQALTRHPLPTPSAVSGKPAVSAGTASAGQNGAREEGPVSPFAIAWISDTQLYAESYPETFTAMTSWVDGHRTELSIMALMHTGDVVNNRKSEKQWKNAVEAMGKLRLPALIAAGNHDVWTPETDYVYFSRHFGTANDPDTITWENGKGQYRVFSAGGLKVLLLALGYGTGAEGIAWADEVLSRYPDHYAILGFHSYMTQDGVLGSAGRVFYRDLVKPHANVKLVLCGHYHGVGRRDSRLDDDGDGTADRTVVQLLADYQGEEQGGGGYLRLLLFDPAAKEVRVETYSPILDDKVSGADASADLFSFPLEI